MRKMLFVWLSMLIGLQAIAQNNQNIVGKWKTVDDETGEAKSIVEVFQKADGRYYGKISKLLIKPENDKCVQCKDDRKNQPLLGLEIIRGITKKGNEFSGGTITDPKNGKMYKCTITREGNKLLVRGYVGFSLIGRTQTWQLVN
ncbi:DUF2147 domain-containing protein [Sphingobacterium corticibacterium]|uniref:DUF2147 domain-containing protein n=1 Tax=Sphingobacterium corticibacterium TaxID=2484746 RepID=A0A4V2DC30_9SPHI|nr:DUF2147 domain-containing protein [Sphingobacterium corticibacterium]RZF60058.1 DUF2147 domain-containing protein [Sphingobacterium corticibacterium]